jgi:hypothetical protein
VSPAKATDMTRAEVTDQAIAPKWNAPMTVELE